MKNFIKSSFIVLLLVTANAIAHDISAVVEQVENSVVTINGIEPLGNGKGRASTGTGFIISTDGYIVTCAHVVTNTVDITATMSDGSVFPVSVVKLNIDKDVALLKIEANGLNQAILGNNSKTKVGEEVILIGAPMGLYNTVTHGIISAKNRVIPDFYGTYLQTDAAANPGNSGGAMFNMNGEVIGQLSNIVSLSGGSIGLGFALSIEDVMEAIK